MARKCCVKNCVSTIGKSNDKKLYKLPGDIKLRTKWLKNCGIVDNTSSDGTQATSYSTQSTPGLYVCWRHFRNSDYEPLAGQRGLSLKKDAVPTVFQDYGKNSDAFTMPVKSHNYPQEDLDLINSKSLPRRASAARLDSPNDSSGEACNSRPHSSADSLNPSESQEENENGEVLGIQQEKPKKAETKDTPPAEPPPGIRPLDVLSEVQNQASLENVHRVVSRGDLNFFPGAKLEAKDFNDQWYAARVVEIDWADGEALIHFEKWSARFDEWIPMDSPRLRELRSIQPSDLKTEQDWIVATPDPRAKDFEIGERVLATWADGRKYPAKVNAVLGNDRYDVLFDDGYSKVVRSSKMTKIAGTSEKPVNNQQQSPQMDPEPYIGSKQERRDKKRKHTVTELFHVRKRVRGDEKSSKKDEMPEDHEQEVAVAEIASPSFESEPLRGFPATTKKTKNHQRRKRDYPKADEDDDEYGPEWIDGEPQGIESLTSDGTRRSIIVSDRRLPPGWQKHFVQRKTGSSAGKWDVVFVHELTEKKFRSRSDLKSFFEAQGQPNFNTDIFDFCIHRRKKSGARNHAAKSENSVEPPKKIKTLLPKAKASPTPPQPVQENLTTTTPISSPFVQASTPATPDDSAVFIGGLRVEMEDSAYKCPIEGCTKTFRKENLLQMHIKHYHKEYSQFVGSTPNVADLAYARTIGESIQDLAPRKSTDKRKSFQNSHTMSPLAAPEISITEHDSKLELMSPASAHSQDVSDDGGHRIDPGAMSPGALFDLKLKEEKTPVSGIKTLLPLRPASDRSKSVDESGHFEKIRGQRKRQLSEYSSDSAKGRKSKGPHDISEEYGDLDDSALDAEGPAGLVYRYSRRKSDAKSDDNSQSNGEGMMMLINGELVKVEQLKREEIINCACTITEEDGLMIQCDLCLCWQHGHCHGIEREADVPEKYVCSICRNPFRGRESNRYVHNQDWIKEGKLETMTTRNQDAVNQQTALLKRSFELVAALNAIRDILHSLRVKINVAQKKDHPKLYLWAKHWEKIDIPAPQLEPVPIMQIIDPKAEENHENTKIKMEDEDEGRDDVLEAKHELMKILEDSSVINGDKEEKGLSLMGALMKDDEEVKKENNEEKEETGVPLEEPVKTMQPIIPEPEAPIDLEECRSRLLDHIMHYQAHVDSRLDTVEAQIDALEEIMDSNKPPSPEITARFKQTVQMLNRDLITMRKLAVFDEERREQEQQQQQQQLQQQQVS